MLLVLPISRVTDSYGIIYPGALLDAFDTLTTNRIDVYTSADLDTPHANPVEADANGLLPIIFLDPAKVYRFRFRNAAGANISGMDFDPVSSLNAANIVFTQTGTGAVTRTVSDKLNEAFLSVKDFGAVGDGATDDTVAIQATVDAAEVLGGTVFFPSSHGEKYKITDTIIISSTFTVNLVSDMFNNAYGPSAGHSCILIGGVIAGPVFTYIAPGSRASHGSGTVSGLSFMDPTGTSGTPGTRTVDSCLFLKDFNLGLVERCSFHYIAGKAIQTEFAAMATVRGCRIRYSGATSKSPIDVGAFDSTYLTQAFNIEDCRIEVCHNAPYVNVNALCTDIRISNCQFETAPEVSTDTSQTYIVMAATRFTIQSCGFNRNTAEAVTVSGRGQLSECNFACSASSSAALKITGSYCLVNGCTFSEPRAGYQIHITGIYNRVTDNHFYETGGVLLLGAGNVFSENTIILDSSDTYAPPNAGTINSKFFIQVIDFCQVNFNTYYSSTGTPNVHCILLTGTNPQCQGNLFRAWGNSKIAIRSESTSASVCNNRHDGNGTFFSQASGMGGPMAGNWGSGGGEPLLAALTWDPGSLVDGAGETSSGITVTGAVFGDYVEVAAPYDLQGILCVGYVSASDTVKIRIQNETGGTIDLASGSWLVTVKKRA